MIYLDNAATTPISPKVLDAMLPYFKEEYGNAGAVYGLGRRAAEAIAKSRQQVADFVGAKPEQIIFTSGGTEANNLAILGCRRYLKEKGKTHIITSSVEHDSVLQSVKALCRNEKDNIKDGFYASFLDVDSTGYVSENSVAEEITDKTGLVSVMCVNNEVGTKNPVASIGCICKGNDVLFHTDCVQAAGTWKLNVDEIHCDFMSISSHKIHGPKGVGALYVRDKSYLSSLINGGAVQEFGLRGGTENVAGIVGFGAACELMAEGLETYMRAVASCKQCFYNVLKERGLDQYMTINGTKPSDLSKVLNITFEGIDAETLLLMLDSEGVCVSAGSACQSHESKPSHVLTAMGLTSEQARSSIRISFSEMTGLSEVKKAASILAECVKTLRSCYSV